MTVGYYQSLESFALVDGPGVRSVLFLAGCPFRCLFCHNPDSWAFSKKNPITPEEAYKKLIRYKPYWRDNGGVTISGGEPLAQLDFIIELSRLFHNEGISVAIDTSGATFNMSDAYLKKFDELLQVSDLFLLDIKAVDSSLHKKITGKDNKNVLELFSYLDKKNYPIWVRHVLVPTLSDNDERLRETHEFLSKFKNIRRVEVLPYHTLGTYKYDLLKMEYPLKDVPAPTKERVEKAEKILCVKDYPDYK